MSNPFNPGDRVRVVGLENKTPSTETAAAILRGEVDGEVTDFTEKWTVVNFGGQNYHVPTKNLQRVSSRRTFEEIIIELAEKPCMSDWKVRFMDCGAHYADFECDYLNPLYIYTNGEVWWARDERQSHLSAAQLAAIAAACTEIAANFAAKHGKDEQQ